MTEFHLTPEIANACTFTIKIDNRVKHQEMIPGEAARFIMAFCLAAFWEHTENEYEIHGVHYQGHSFKK